MNIENDDGTRMRKSYVIFGGLLLFFVALYYSIISSTPPFARHERWEYKVEKFEMFRPDPAEYRPTRPTRPTRSFPVAVAEDEEEDDAKGKEAVRYFDDLWGNSHKSFGEILDKNGKLGWIYVGMEHFEYPERDTPFYPVNLPVKSIYRAEKVGIRKSPYQTLIFKRPL